MRLLIPTASAQSANMSITTQYKMRRIVHTNNHINIGMVLLAGSENRASLQVIDSMSQLNSKPQRKTRGKRMKNKTTLEEEFFMP